MDETRQPGAPEAIEAGCTCPAEQPYVDQRRYRADPDCALHGLHLAKAELEEGC